MTRQGDDVPPFVLVVTAALFALFAFPQRRCGCTRAACRACFRANACCPHVDHDSRDW